MSLAGAGNIQVDAALGSPAYLVTLDANAAPSPLVSASWGAQVSASPFELSHTVRVVNPSAVAVTYGVLSGQDISGHHPSRVDIVAHGPLQILSADPARLPRTLEGQVVRLADIVAYLNHDLDDALQAGRLESPQARQLGASLGGLDIAVVVELAVELGIEDHVSTVGKEIGPAVPPPVRR